MAPFPIGLVQPDSADCDRNWRVDPNCPRPSDQDDDLDNDEVVPFSWDDLDMDKDKVTSTTEQVKVATQEMTKHIVKKITKRILDATRRTTKTVAAQDGFSSTPGYQVFNIGDEQQDDEDDSFSIVMTVGGVVVTVFVIGSIGKI